MNTPRRVISSMLVLVANAAHAGPPEPAVFSPQTRSVTLDGVALGSGLTPQTANSLRFSVAYEAGTRRYHLWVQTGDDPAFDPASLALSNLRHAVSGDGVSFTSTGNLDYLLGNPFPGPYNTQVDPPIAFVRGQFFDGEWKLLFWHANDSSGQNRWGDFNYNTSVAALGSVPDDRLVLQQGPLVGAGGGTSPGGQHVGPFGLVNHQLYLRVDSASGGLARFAYGDGLPPETAPFPNWSSEADLFAGSPYVWFLANPSAPNAGYVHNAGRVLTQLDGSLAAYYAFRRADGTRAERQLWRVVSNDDGLTWAAAQPVFANDAAFTLDGAPIPANGLFSGPDVVQDGQSCRVYFATLNAAGEHVVVVSTALATPQPSACYRPDAIFADGFEQP